MSDKITHDDALAFAEAVADYITNRNPKLPGCLQRALHRHKSDEWQERRHARIMWCAADAMGLHDFAAESVAKHKAEGEEWASLVGRAQTDDEVLCRETGGLDSAVWRGIANMDELGKLEALGLALVAVAKAARK